MIKKLNKFFFMTEEVDANSMIWFYGGMVGITVIATMFITSAYHIAP